jgi:hypothetical protein
MSDSRPESDELAPEYDLSDSRPNPYAERYARGSNLVRIDPDVAKVFPDAKSVNDALRAIARIIEQRTSAA